MDGLLRKVPRGTLSQIGSHFGPVGAVAGDVISRISGYGSYKVNHNTLGTDTVIGAEAQNIPTFRPSEHGSRVRHREFIGNVVVPSIPSQYANQSYRVSVDNAELFPWLSQLAARYQKYKVHGMVFYFKSTSTDYNNSGTVAVAMNYNATEDEYSSLDQVLNSMFAVNAKPSESFAAPLECDPKTMPEGGYYVRHAESLKQGIATDLRLSSLGTLNVVTEGLTLPADTVLGQIWCTYDIELLFPYVTKEPTVPITTYNQTGGSIGHPFSLPMTDAQMADFTADLNKEDNNNFTFVPSPLNNGQFDLHFEGLSELIGKRIDYYITTSYRGTNPGEGVRATAFPSSGLADEGVVDAGSLAWDSYPSNVVGSTENGTSTCRRWFRINASSGIVRDIVYHEWTPTVSQGTYTIFSYCNPAL